MRAPSIALILALSLGLLSSPSTEASRKGKFDKAEFKLGYRSALDRLARGEAEGALADLVALESRFGEQARGRLEPLWKAKLSVVRDLLGAGAELLVPVSQLHEQAYLAHRDDGSYALASHSRGMTIELAELYAERVKGTHGMRVAGAIITSMAGHLHAAFVDSTATVLYQRALELDPDNGAAMLGLAGVFERHGEYDKALPVLRRLGESTAASPEGRLRLAVHLIRVDERQEAEALLLRLIADPVREPRWVHAVAFQELARILIDRDEFEEAAALLDGATRTLGGDPTLPILLAYVSDRARRPISKAEMTSALRAAAIPDSESPRYRYSRMPRRALEALRVALSGESAAQLPTLAQALSDEDVLASAGSR